MLLVDSRVHEVLPLQYYSQRHVNNALINTFFSSLPFSALPFPSLLYSSLLPLSFSSLPFFSLLYSTLFFSSVLLSAPSYLLFSSLLLSSLLFSSLLYSSLLPLPFSFLPFSSLLYSSLPALFSSVLLSAPSVLLISRTPSPLLNHHLISSSPSLSFSSLPNSINTLQRDAMQLRLTAAESQASMAVEEAGKANTDLDKVICDVIDSDIV